MTPEDLEGPKGGALRKIATGDFYRNGEPPVLRLICAGFWTHTPAKAMVIGGIPVQS
jgi:hypothetical protein